MIKLRKACLALLASASVMHAQQPVAAPLSLQQCTASASSCGKNTEAANVIDGNWKSHWQSEPPMPYNYIGSRELNLFSAEDFTTSGTLLAKTKYLCDGDLGTEAQVLQQQGFANIILQFNSPTYLDVLSLKILANDDIDLEITLANGNSVQLGNLSSSDNYSINNFPVKALVSSIEMSSGAPFSIFEMAGIGELVYEDLVVDLKQHYILEEVKTKLLPHASLDSVQVAVSNDSVNWTRVGLADIQQYGPSQLVFKQSHEARYLRYRSHMNHTDWASVRISESEIIGYLPKLDPFDPNAGVQHNELAASRVATSSEQANFPKENVIDGDVTTSWKPTAPLPTEFIGNDHHNVLLGETVSSTHPSNNALSLITDGDNSTRTVFTTNGPTSFDINFSQPQYLSSLSINAIIPDHKYTIDVVAITTDNRSIKALNYQKSDNYRTSRGAVNAMVRKITVLCDTSFKISELAGIGAGMTEDLVVDFIKVQPIGYIKTRYFGNSGVDSVRYYSSTDSLNWEYHVTFSPQLFTDVTHSLKPETKARYIKAEAFITQDNYQTANLGEIRAYGPEGPYGTMPPATANDRPLADIMGVNGIWGWGHNKYSDDIPAGQGPELFSKLATHARNYQNMWWDTKDPDDTPDYENMNLAMWWLNWDKEYAAWDAAGLDVNVTLQFIERVIAEKRWDNVEKASYDYGYAFARHFGPTHGNGLVKLFEIGNEPWHYTPEFYRKVLYNMARGVKDGDPALPVYACALQSAEPDKDHNWTGNHMDQASANLLDGHNVHSYSYMWNPADGDRIATYPENPLSSMRTVARDIEFRDINMPGKKIIISEWGWDSYGYGLDCKHGECVSPKAQSDYAVRGMLYLDRLGVDQATWFFYGDVAVDKGLYSRSGLVEGYNEKLKRSYKAWYGLKQKIGDYYFSKAVQEDDDAWIYEYADKQGNPAFLVAWLPIDADDLQRKNISISYPFSADSSFALDGAKLDPTVISNPAYSSGQMHLNLSATPIVIKLDNSQVVKKSSAATAQVAVVQAKPIALELEAYPNPSKGSFKLALGNVGGSLSYDVYDIAGQRIYSQSELSVTAGEQLEVNLPELQPGQYILKAELINEGGEQQANLPLMIY